MSKNSNNKLEIYSGILVILIFILISYIIQLNTSLIEENLDKGNIGVFIYLFLTIITSVIAPISAVPILPLAVFLWGWVIAAIISIIGWTIGSMIAFLIGRHYGLPLLKRFMGEKKITKYEKFIPEKSLFLSIIIMRVFLPVDVLSYILGIFSKVNFYTYSLATLIGVIPFAFILSYVGSLSILYQSISFIFGGLMILLIILKYQKVNNKQILEN